MERPRPGFLKMLWNQFDDFLVRLLIIAAILSLFLGEVLDASAIMAIVVLNAILGVIQESRAEQALAEQKDIVNLFMTAVSLAIAAVPEGLPAIVTICLAFGMQRMIKRHALI
jgi:magnesium-transporting ATPase (P-type)